MSREELEKWNCEGLAQYCREHNIPHYHGKNRFRKNEMVDAIIGQENNSQPTKETPPETEEKQDEPKKKLVVNVSQLPGTPKYLENIEVGNLVAFKEGSGRLNTAMVKNASFKRRQLRLETKYGKEFVVGFDDVIWVKTKNRWPRFVLDILKQQQRKRNKDGKSSAGQEERHGVETAGN